MQEHLLLFVRVPFFTIPQIPVLIVKAEHGLAVSRKAKMSASVDSVTVSGRLMRRISAMLP